MPSLVEKLAGIAATIPNLLKQGDNGEYKWIRAIDAFDAVRAKLFAAGILIFPIAQATKKEPFDSITGEIIEEVFTEVIYRITDGVSEIECTAHGVGRDHEGKALYMASTGAKKDLIKTLFLIAGWEDDAENVQNAIRIDPTLAEKISEMEKKFGSDSKKWLISRTDVNAWHSACRSTGLGKKAQQAFLFSKGIDKISALKREDFDQALMWALGKAEVSLGESSSSTDEESSE